MLKDSQLAKWLEETPDSVSDLSEADVASALDASQAR